MKNFLISVGVLILIFVTMKFNVILGTIFVVGFMVYTIIKLRPYYYIIQANKRYSENKREEALELYKKAVSFKSCPINSKVTYGFLLLKMGHPDEADELLSGIINSNIKQDIKWKAKLYYALVLWKKNNIDEAIEYIDEVYKNFKSTLVYETYGLLIIVKGDMKKALEINKEAYDYDNEDASILDNMGRCYYLINENEKACQIYEKLIDKKPTFPEAYYNYALVLLKQGKETEAVEQLKNSLKANFSFLTTINKEDIEQKISEIECK